MIEVLAQLTNTTVLLAVGAVVVVGANAAFGMRVLNRLNSDVGDDLPVTPLTDAAESSRGDTSRNTPVAPPRPRRLQPVPTPVDGPAAGSSEVAAPPRPFKLTSTPPRALEAVPVGPNSGLTALAPNKPTEEPAPKEEVPPAESGATQKVSAPEGALVLDAAVDAPKAMPEVSTGLTLVARGLPKPDAPGEMLPPLPPVLKTQELPARQRKFFEQAAPTGDKAGSATAGAATPAAIGGAKESKGLPPLTSLVPPATEPKAAIPLTTVGGQSSVVPAEPGADLDLPKPGEVASEPPVKAEAPKVEHVGSGVMAVSGPSAPAAESDKPVGEAKTPEAAPVLPSVDAVRGSGLILIPPPVTELKTESAAKSDAEKRTRSALGVGDAAPVVASVAPVDPAAEKPADPVQSSADPVLAPAVADLPAAAKPPAEAKVVKGPRVFLPGRFFGRGKETPPTTQPAVQTPPVPAAGTDPDKTDLELPKITTPAAAPAAIVPPVEEVAVVPEAKDAAKLPEPGVKNDVTPEAKAPEAGLPTTDKAPETKPVSSVGTQTASSAVEIPAGKSSEAPATGDKPALGTAAKAKEENLAKIVEPAAASEPEKLTGDKPVESKAEATGPAPDAKSPATTEADKDTKPTPDAGEEAKPAPTAATEKSTPEVESAKVEPAKVEAHAEPAAETKPTTGQDDTTPLPSASLVQSPSSTPAAPATESAAEPPVKILPVEPSHEPAHAVDAVGAEASLRAESPAEPAAEQLALAPKPTDTPAESIIPTHSVMSSNDTTNSVPNTGRASAQLTLGFEITSLQLTPFFKLGSVQLKALSNVVSLHLVAAQADNPLAAGISFQIEHVELDGASHLKSILLKPLGESREATVPLPKLQVDNVAVTGGGEGAPISVTTSGQASTAVQLFATFTIAAMEFTPAFEIGSLRLEPNSNTVLLRVAPSSRPTALDLPPSFEVAAVQLGDGAQIAGMRLTPGGAK